MPTSVNTAKQATNWTAIAMFGIFVGGTLFITKWAAGKTKTAADFYTAGGGITGFQNGLAIAGDYMSAASFLGISGLVFANGFDGLIFSIGWLVGWPVITFLMAERLRNLGKFTFADVASYRFAQTPIRIFAAIGTLVVVAFYMIAQMVGAGQLIKVLFGLDYMYAEILVGVDHDDVRAVRRHDRDDLGADHQGLHAARRRHLHGAVPCCCSSVSRPEALFTKAVEVHTKHDAIMGAGRADQGSDLGHLRRHGADVRYRRSAAHPDALLHRAERQGSPQVGGLGDDLDRLLLHPDLHHRFRRHHQPDPESGRLLRRWRNRPRA